MVWATSVEELPDEFMISKTQDDSAAVENVVFSSVAKTCCGRGHCWLNHQTARFIVLYWPFCNSRTFKILISINTVMSKGHTPTFLKLAVFFSPVNRRSKASLIIPGRLCIEIVFPGLLSSQLFGCACFVLNGPSLLHPVAGVGEWSGVGRCKWRHSVYSNNKVLHQVCSGFHDCQEVPGWVLLCYSKYSAWCAAVLLKIEGLSSSHLLANWQDQYFLLLRSSPMHYSF